MIKVNSVDERNALLEMFGSEGWKKVFLPQLRTQRDNLVTQFVYNPSQVDPNAWREAVKFFDYILGLEAKVRSVAKPDDVDPITPIDF